MSRYPLFTFCLSFASLRLWTRSKRQSCKLSFLQIPSSTNLATARWFGVEARMVKAAKPQSHGRVTHFRDCSHAAE